MALCVEDFYPLRLSMPRIIDGGDTVNFAGTFKEYHTCNVLANRIIVNIMIDYDNRVKAI